MPKNFIECKEEKEVAERGHQEQPLGCRGGVHWAGLLGDGGRQTGRTGLALSGADGK